MMIRKLVSAALAALMLSAALCGCGSQEKNSGSSENASVQTEPVSTAAASSQASKQESGSGNTSAVSAQTDGLSQNDLKPENFSKENGFIIYSDEGGQISETGVDVSSYSGDIDWNRVKDTGVSFVMVRLGGRGYAENGALYSDDRAAEYISGAQAAGLKTGGYFFSQAVTPGEAREEAEYCRSLLNGLELDYPLAYDWEIIEDDEARTDNMTVEETTACARAFCDAVREFGWQPMLYASDAELSSKYQLSELSDVEIWYSEYDSGYPSFPYKLGMWQYSKTAEVDGMNGSVDLNIRFNPNH